MEAISKFNPSLYSFDELYRVLNDIRGTDPVFWSDRYNCWVVTTYDDVFAVANSECFSISGSLAGAQPNGICPAAREELKKGVDWLVTENIQSGEGAVHSRMRGAIVSVVTPARLREMRPIIEQIVTDLIDAMESRGECDFVADFAYPLAMLTTLKLIGFHEAEKDMDRIPMWVDETFKFFVKPMDDAEQVIAARNAVKFQKYVNDKIAERRANPVDDQLGLVLKTLTSEPWKLTDDELVIMFTQTFVGAGQETTKLGLSNMMLHLLVERSRWDSVVRNPDSISRNVNEALRVDAPLLGIFRTCIQDTQIGNQEVKEGQKVFVMLASANHDHSKFSDADSFCPFRDQTRPIMTFNSGNHFCAGANLARMEMKIALEQLSKRLPSLRLKQGQAICYKANDVNRFLSALHLEWDASRS